MRERAREDIGTALTMTMDVKAIYPCRQLCGQVVCQHAEARTGGTRIVKFGLYLAILGVHTKTERNGISLNFP